MPGPLPSYRPVFSEEDLAYAHHVAASHHESYQRVLRARLALLLADQPTLSSPQAAWRLGVHEQWVRKWRKRWAIEGFSLDDKPRPGRPRRFSPTATDPGQGHRL